MNRIPDPLDANERALAELLARDALPGPSPQLDARILTAARAASQPAASPRRPRPRWIAGMGIAATLLLAVGIAWRMRPLPPRAPVASEAPQAQMVRMVEPGAGAAATPAAVDEVAARQAPPPQPQPAAQDTKAEHESSVAADKASPAQSPVVFDEPSPMDAQAPAPAPPPAPAPAMAPMANGMPAPAAAATQSAKMHAPTASATPEAYESVRPQEDARTLDRIETTGSRIRRDVGADAASRDADAASLDAAAAADAAAEDGVPRALLDEEPPATADSPQVQEAWLQRIRELLSAGETDAARNSLAEFRRRYPKYALPEDLRRFAAP